MPDLPEYHLGRVAEALKTFFSPELVRRLAREIVAVHPPFRARAFVRRAVSGLDELELLDRGRHIADSLAAHLPASYPEAIEVLLASLGPEHATDELVGVGMAPFFYLPHTIFVAERGLEHFELSMRAQYELTKRFSAEASIRPYIARDPDRTFGVLSEWSNDPNPHVRRLVSEGTRMRLPWAMRVPWLDRNPGHVLELLDRLKDDPATLVRRSVANNLNDLGKLHPELLTRTCARWLADETPERRALVEHALRSAIKRGDAAALAVIGYAKKPAVALEAVKFTPARPRIGESVTIAFDLRSTALRKQELLVDVALHFVKARGQTSKKVFKVARSSLDAKERACFRVRVSLAIHTTRRPHPGRHAVDVLVNGVARPAGAFVVRAAASGPAKRPK